MLPSFIYIYFAGGICFAYNADLFYRDIFPNYDLGWSLFFVTFVVGSTGVIAGGIVSDKVAAKMGIRSRVAVLAISQVIRNKISTPIQFHYSIDIVMVISENIFTQKL